MKPILRTILTIACIVIGGVFLLVSYHQPTPNAVAGLAGLFGILFCTALYLHLSDQ